jgi:AraC-like DNA-binding protein
MSIADAGCFLDLETRVAKLATRVAAMGERLTSAEKILTSLQARYAKDSRRLDFPEAHADELPSERCATTGLRGLVEGQLLSVLCPKANMQAAEIAAQLGMSERALRRRLAEEGTSFGEVLDHLRNRLALQYLEDDRVSIKQIAWLLGYSEPGAFNHAFKRWTGTSPTQAKNRRT